MTRPNSQEETIEVTKHPGSPPHIERMAYRSAGTSSVSAQRSEQGGKFGFLGPTVPGGHQNPILPSESVTTLSNRIIELEGRLGNAEITTSGQLEQMRYDSAEHLKHALDQAEQTYKAAIEAAAQHFGSALKSFEAEKGNYFERVEREVVRLALAIAARILNRESNLDPLLLAGAVRVALRQLGETSGIRLRCPIDQVTSWADLLRSPLVNSSPPEIVGDPSLSVGDCVLEAVMGNVDLGVRSQLEEIERGFFDLLELRRGPDDSVRNTV